MTDKEIITCQKSQIEDLKEALEERMQRIEVLEAEVKELEAQVDSQYEQAEADILGNMPDGGVSCHWCINKHRTAAIREFAEYVKANRNRLFNTVYSALCFGEKIDAFVKEMTEDSNE